MFNYREITNVAPMSAAFNAMLKCETPYFIQVDADMVLTGHSVENLYNAISTAPSNVAIYCDWLWGDIEERPICGVKAYRADIVKRYPFTDCYSCETDQQKRMEADGYKSVIAPVPGWTAGDCTGVHHGAATPELAFARWYRLMQKSRRYDYMTWLSPYPRRLFERYLLNPDERLLGALCGALAGLGSPLGKDAESDYRNPPRGYRRLKAVLSGGPSELVVYCTTRCNHACPHCARTINDKREPADFAPAMLEQVLTLHPSIKSACLAGFGEPLLNPHMRELCDVLRVRGKPYGLITNGALLAKMVGDVAAWGCSYVAVSINTADAAEHKALSGVDNFDEICTGIRELAATGTNAGINHIVTTRNLGDVPRVLELAHDLGARFVNLVNLLPHGGPTDEFWSSVLTTEHVDAIDALKTAPHADLVNVWPKLITRDSEPPRACKSPFAALGVDPLGHVTGCRRVVGPQPENGHFAHRDLWHNDHFSGLRRAMSGDSELFEECTACFASWVDYV